MSQHQHDATPAVSHRPVAIHMNGRLGPTCPLAPPSGWWIMMRALGME